MMFARAIHLDESDMRVFECPARTGEWCVAGGFEFSNSTECDLTGQARQAFANGWLGCETFGRVSFVAVTRIEAEEYDRLADTLAAHFVTRYGAPTLEAARTVALQELAHMAELCDGHNTNTLLTVARELSPVGVRETFRVIPPQEADLALFAIHVTDDAPHRH